MAAVLIGPTTKTNNNNIHSIYDMRDTVKFESTVQWVPDLSPGLKRSGRGADHPPPSSAEVEVRVELYIYSPIWAFVACSRETFTFTFESTIQ
jgi:hypothetical protein